MRTKIGDEHGSSRGRIPASARRGRRPLPVVRLARRSRTLVAMAIAVVGLSAFAASASGDGTTTLPGGPLIVSIGTLGECQSNYVNGGNNFYPGEGTLGDCGFFLAFPEAGNPVKLQKTVYGFEGVAGPHLLFAEGGVLYTAISQGAPTGSGTATEPYTQVTTFKVSNAESGLDYVLITETTTYVNGAPQFTSTFDVQNITGTAKTSTLNPAPSATLKFHAIYAGDLYTNNSDYGTGVFLAGPPPFIGGQNNTTGVLGGLIQAASPSPPWNNYETGCWNEVPEGRCMPASPLDIGIWNAVRKSATATSVFNDDVDPNLIDNATGVSWDDHLTSGLAPGAHATYSIINRAQVPTTLSVQPVNQSLTVGQTGTITVTATDTAGTPYAGRSLVYSIAGANPKSGSITTNSAGVATLSYVGASPGLDTIQMFLDLGGTGVQEPQDPASTAQITWVPKPPTPPSPNSSYKIQSIHANSNGTITITFVPTQGGTGTLEVTVPTGTIARREAIAAKKKAKKCKKGQVKIKGKCRPATTVSGKLSATGVAGVPLTLTVKPSSKVTKALKNGKNVTLTAKLTYKSALGGTPTVETFTEKIKGKKKKRH